MIFDRRRVSENPKRKDAKKNHYARKSDNYKRRMDIQRMRVGNIGKVGGDSPAWTEEEMLALNSEKTHREIAVDLGKSLHAVSIMCLKVKYARKRKAVAMRKGVKRTGEGIRRGFFRSEESFKRFQRLVRKLYGTAPFRPYDGLHEMGEARYYEERR